MCASQGWPTASSWACCLRTAWLWRRSSSRQNWTTNSSTTSSYCKPVSGNWALTKFVFDILSLWKVLFIHIIFNLLYVLILFCVPWSWYFSAPPPAIFLICPGFGSNPALVHFSIFVFKSLQKVKWPVPVQSMLCCLPVWLLLPSDAQGAVFGSWSPTLLCGVGFSSGRCVLTAVAASTPSTGHTCGKADQRKVPGQLWVCAVVQEVLWRQPQWAGQGGCSTSWPLLLRP